MHRAMSPKNARHFRRFAGMPKSSKHASAAPPEYQGRPFCGWFSDVHPDVGAVVEIVKVAVPLFVPDRLTWPLAGVQLNVGGKFAPVGLLVTVALSVTTPVNPPEVGATVIVDVFPLVAPGAMLTPVPLTVKEAFPAVPTASVTDAGTML